MSWTRLNRIHVHPFFSRKLRKQVENLNADIEGQAAMRTAIDDERAKVRGTDVVEINFDNLAPVLRAKVLAALQQELRIRERLHHLHDAVRAEAVAAHDDENTKFQATKAEVRAALATIGYPPPPNEGEPDSLPPIFLFRHPLVRELQGRVGELLSLVNTWDQTRENSDAYNLIEQQLIAARDASAAAV